MGDKLWEIVDMIYLNKICLLTVYVPKPSPPRPHVPNFQCPHFTNASMSQCPNTPKLKCPNASKSLSQRSNVPKSRYPNVKMSLSQRPNALNVTLSQSGPSCDSNIGSFSRAQIKPKYKSRNIRKKFTDQTNITECIGFHRLAFVSEPAPQGLYGHDVSPSQRLAICHHPITHTDAFIRTHIDSRPVIN